MTGGPTVFVSYARSDGLVFARRLRDWLEKKNINVWQDLVGMKGGEDFLLQIFKAIDQVKFLVLLMTPNALKSDAVKKEWRYARQRGVCVYPVLVPQLTVDFSNLPRWWNWAGENAWRRGTTCV